MQPKITKTLAIAILALAMLAALAMPVRAIEVDLPPIDAGMGIWQDFDTGVKTIVATATSPFATYKAIKFNAGIVLPSDMEKLDLGFVVTFKLGDHWEIGGGTRDWLKKDGMLLRYTF